MLTNKETLNKSVQDIKNSEVVEQLRREAQANKAFNAVMHTFAMRERTRKQVTVNNLYLTMKREGFDIKRSEIQRILQFMAKLELGKIEKTPRGFVKVLKNIPFKLQSIAVTSLGGVDKLPTVTKTVPQQIVNNSPVRNEKTDILKIQYGKITINFESFPESKLIALLDLIGKFSGSK